MEDYLPFSYTFTLFFIFFIAINLKIHHSRKLNFRILYILNTIIELKLQLALVFVLTIYIFMVKYLLYLIAKTIGMVYNGFFS